MIIIILLLFTTVRIALIPSSWLSRTLSAYESAISCLYLSVLGQLLPAENSFHRGCEWRPGLEIKRECIFGSLSSLKAAALPCIAALGGMVPASARQPVGVQGRSGKPG